MKESHQYSSFHTCTQIESLRFLVKKPVYLPSQYLQTKPAKVLSSEGHLNCPVENNRICLVGRSWQEMPERSVQSGSSGSTTVRKVLLIQRKLPMLFLRS